MTSSDPAGHSAVDVEPVDKIVVVGTGFVGLPLALVLADEGKEVVGVDIDRNIVEAINDQSLQLDEAALQALLESDTVDRNLTGRTEPTAGDAFVISVPTPLREPTKSPDLTHIEAAVESILPYLEPGNVVNVESTVPPLTCREVVAPRLEEAGFEVGTDVQLAHSPERILPGNVFEEIVENDRVIGGVDAASRARAAKIYEPFLEGEVYYTDLVTAELCKLMENTYRDVNVAVANEFSLIADQLDVDADELIGLANNHPRVEIMSPGIGVGGHCLPVDPWFLNEVDPEHTNLITSARRINDMMPAHTARKIRHRLAAAGADRVLALGAAYKPDTYDQRNSPANEVVEELRLDGYEVVHRDRHVDGMGYDSLRSLIDDVEPDAVVELVSHTDTVAELEGLETPLSEAGVRVMRFGQAE